MAVLFVILFQYVYFWHLRKERKELVAKYGVLYSEFMLCTPQVYKQQRVVNKHTPVAMGSHLGAVGGSVSCSRLSPHSWYWRWKRVLYIHSPPPTIPAGIETRTCDLWVTSTVMLGFILFYRSFSHCSYFETEHGVEHNILSILEF